jgi:Xaa-Pro aminopeptidase
MIRTPFDSRLLDSLMEASGVDWVVATSSHNVQYLLGGYCYFFYDHFSAIGLSRYLPLVGYPRGDPQRAFYVAAANEAWQLEVQPVWIERIETAAVTSTAAAEVAAAVLKEPAKRLRIAVEPSFVPSDAMKTLSEALSGAEFIDATPILETLRCIKTSRELDLLRSASVGIVEAMLATFRTLQPGTTKDELAAHYSAELTARAMAFDYAFVTFGRSLNRAPFGGRLERGQLLSLDSGGRLDGYVGDLCRMAVMGEPNPEMKEALDEVANVQAVARGAVRRGTEAAAIYEAAHEQVALSPHRERMRFVAHGIGLITHEAPRLTDRAGVPYPATHASQPLETGMALSVETHIADPNLGFVKLEDTLIVTADGYEALGDLGRGWNLAGTLH